MHEKHNEEEGELPPHEEHVGPLEEHVGMLAYADVASDDGQQEQDAPDEQVDEKLLAVVLQDGHGDKGELGGS